jgi:lipopolysaccharide export LptBFGC system permease protein LptF
MVTILDRYLGARILRPFGASIAIVIMLLSLENSARLIGQLNEVEQPLGVFSAIGMPSLLLMRMPLSRWDCLYRPSAKAARLVSVSAL